MGQIRLFASFRDRLPNDVEKRLHMTGLEGIPWPSKSFWSGENLVVHRNIDESGYVSIPWLASGGREVLLTTSTVREQPNPYLLELELARGLINRIRNQAAAWGIDLSASSGAIAGPWRTTLEHFIAAATSHYTDQRAAAANAIKAIEAGLEAQAAVISKFTSEFLHSRVRESGRLNTLFATRVPAVQTIPQANALVSTFNAISVEPTWRNQEKTEGDVQTDALAKTLEWCHANRLRVCLGPLLRFDKKSLPDWIYLWDDDFEALRNCVANYAGEIVSRFKGKTHIWEIAGAANLRGDLDLNEDQQLQLVVAGIEAVRSRDQQTPLVVGFTQPWAEYISADKWEISPLHVADALVRAEVGVVGFSLELQLGYAGRDAPCRHLLDLGEMIDRWGQLGAPILVRLVAPSSPGNGIAPGYRADPIQHAEMLNELIHLLLCKPVVHGIIYQQWSDVESSEFPHGGLLAENGAAKPALEKLKSIRQSVLH